MTKQRMDSLEEEALFQSYPYATLYFVQSPATTVSHQHDTVSFHSPATQRRLTLSHYSSSRGSTNSFLHEKKTPYGPHESPEHGGIGGGVAEMSEKCSDFIDGENMHGGSGGGPGGDGAEEVESEEEEDLWRKREWYLRLFSFKEFDSWIWICFQLSLRAMVSFGIALFFFYLITKPPPPIITLQIERMKEFRLAEGVDNTGVSTEILTFNCSVNLLVNIKSILFGLHIAPPILTISFNNLPLAASRGTEELYAYPNGPTSFLLYIGTRNKPMYGAGRSMQDILQSGKRLELVVRVSLRSSYHVVGKLISPRFHHRVECLLVLVKNYHKQHRTLVYHNQCNII